MTIEWIPIEEDLPEVNEYGCSDYLLLSFENFNIPEIGRYEVDKEGNGAFYAGDDAKSLSSYGLFVNAWMPIIPCYKG